VSQFLIQVPFSPKLIVVLGASSQLSSILNLYECVGHCIPEWSAEEQQHLVSRIVPLAVLHSLLFSVVNTLQQLNIRECFCIIFILWMVTNFYAFSIQLQLCKYCLYIGE
jgi:hypothetical protein